jgi:hypothetical protein
VPSKPSVQTRRMLDRVARYAASLSFPDGPHPTLGYRDFALPLDERFVDGPKAHDQTPRRVVELLLGAAVRLARDKPSRLGHTRVIAYVPIGDLFHCGIDVIFDEAYWRGFMNRQSEAQTWTPLGADQSLLTRLGLTLPEGFEETGFHTVSRDASMDPPYDHEEGEIWVYAEVLPTDPSPSS